ncbi:MAG: 8-oxoguanine DNA glycosylase, N-terminal domain-containing protein, partial [Oscillospiraceae bacterium]|nr:8-oxoguanine DNA glycosylase, N-terminal domain-containing protein [Oscillospiraceae bacterium]
MDDAEFNLPADEFDLTAIFECGQCFRWNADGQGAYTGIAFGRAAAVRRTETGVRLTAAPEDLPRWREYFDLGRDYAEIR